MSTELTECPNCRTKLKSGILSNVTLLSKNVNAIINEYHEKKVDSYCSKCVGDLQVKYASQLQREKEQISSQIQNLIDVIPVVSINSPLNWEYEIINMVTGQSTTGTGVISELSSSLTDLFGTQSGQFNKKLKGGENMCFSQLRKHTLDLGGNAVIATDIDYSEVGGDKGMLMVCMGGTAIKLKNTNILGAERSKQIEELINLNARMKILNALNTNEI